MKLFFFFLQFSKLKKQQQVKASTEEEKKKTTYRLLKCDEVGFVDVWTVFSRLKIQNRLLFIIRKAEREYIGGVANVPNILRVFTRRERERET